MDIGDMVILSSHTQSSDLASLNFFRTPGRSWLRLLLNQRSTCLTDKVLFFDSPSMSAWKEGNQHGRILCCEWMNGLTVGFVPNEEALLLTGQRKSHCSNFRSFCFPHTTTESWAACLLFQKPGRVRKCYMKTQNKSGSSSVFCGIPLHLQTWGLNSCLSSVTHMWVKLNNHLPPQTNRVLKS